MDNVMYTVLPGNTLWGIANFFGVTVDEIANENNITERDLIYPAQVLRIPVSAPRPPQYYTVRPSDTLYIIASRYGLAVEDILKMNPIMNPNMIYPGQILRLI